MKPSPSNVAHSVRTRLLTFAKAEGEEFNYVLIRYALERFSGDRYKTLERRVTTAAGQTIDLGDVRLPVVRGIVTIILATPGARVLLIHGSEHHEVPTMPLSVEFDTGKRWVLHATLSGYCEMVEPIDFSDGTAKKTIEVKLVAGCGP